MIYLDGKRYCTPLEGSKILAIPKATIFHWVKHGEVATMPLDRSTLIKRYGFSDSIYLIDYDLLIRKKAESHLTLTSQAAQVTQAAQKGDTNERGDTGGTGSQES